ncbi:ABC transporter permease [Lactobacillus mulieris]|uniref:ABC transporter permease n=1 Tax=Lactobacillus mulieris TaxID=2508708 RepID=UPI00143288AC|nr:ABC transporter permease [Lactobacillus mulieris]MCF1783169.1 ABC transporter permease [Lactobacillus mulieris]MCW8104250.1 ABC transporter permease [Lactobacillus mulieris]MDK6802918.1 ABC transporter permease [Lactobacillus mulieris]MDK8382034.1 ABC transporter permease [Lactobacillus mulieris]MDT9620496.1 ABC transporter permease [Lactobacillus mulieris]
MKKIWLVTKETFIRQTKGITFILSVLAPVIFMGVIFAVIFATQKLSGSDNQIDNAIVISKNYAPAVKNLSNFEVKSESAAKKALADEDIKGYVKVDVSSSGQITASWLGKEAMASDDKSNLMESLQKLQQSLNVQAAGLTTKQLKTLSQSVKISEKISGHNGSEKKVTQADLTAKSAKTIAANVFIWITYFILLTYISTMAQEIATEKGSKIMEIIFSSMRGGDYFVGKVLGVLGVFLVHVLAYIALLGLAIIVGPKIEMFAGFFKSNHELISQVVSNLISWNLVLLLLSVILSIVLAAFCGALANRVEDLQKILAPIIYIVIIALIAAPSLSKGDSIFAQIVSCLPLLSGFILPGRVAEGVAGTPELIIATLVSVVTLVLAIYYVRKAYPKLILQTDDGSIMKKIKRLKG